MKINLYANNKMARTRKRLTSSKKKRYSKKKNTTKRRKNSTRSKKRTQSKRGGFDVAAAAAKTKAAAQAAQELANKSGMTDAALNALKIADPAKYAQLMEAKKTADALKQVANA
jgi:hypothetical protein